MNLFPLSPMSCNLGDNCGNLGRDIVGYTAGNLALRSRVSRAVKRDFRTYIRRFTSSIENFEYGYPNSNALLQFCLEFERCESLKTACHPTKYAVINDVKQIPIVYRRIYCLKFLTSSIRCRVTKAILMHLLLLTRDLIDNVKNLRQYILRYTI